MGALLIFAATAFGLHLLGRNLVCGCGEILIWWDEAEGIGNSQNLSDWYSLLHFGHGILTWPLLRWLAPQWPLGKSCLVALFMGSGWELVENTPFMIARFGDSGPGDYPCDSILNALSDMSFGLAGFLFARKVRLRAGLAALVAIELTVTVAIRDGFVLGAARLIAPSVVLAEE
ncbi:DUF2585 family protein [Chthonobacter albigriseus]|uniref:DUF2585 family protein n=1 Tax=Chthonobacter albigriseus TaxID=1683161 RepID=UPI0015EF984D|nr:DUF2585 family protein [Chthonobacter albigriseus]